MDDLESKVFVPLPDETWVYPGHGEDTRSALSGRRSRSGAPAAGEGRTSTLPRRSAMRASIAEVLWRRLF